MHLEVGRDFDERHGVGGVQKEGERGGREEEVFGKLVRFAALYTAL